jgi:exodeoxyribonuclease V gamma subunit
MAAMALTIRYVTALREIVAPVREFLTRERDLFATPRIVVPTAGAKAWLWSELARTLGASGAGPDGAGSGNGDGIVANVAISYPGTILGLLQPPRGREPDPWSFDPLMFTVLDVITGADAADLELPFDVTREPLLAARRIAGLFDTYHVRRPAMIARWEAGLPHLSPVATEKRSIDSEWAADPLAASDAWQFRTWQAVRHTIGTPSPPARTRLHDDASREPLLVAGLQTLSLQQIAALRTLAADCEVSVLVVHPSPALRARWAATAPPLSIDVPPPRTTADLPADLDPLVATWLHGARDTQMLLASQGFAPEHLAAPGATVPEPTRLLSRIQDSITTAAAPVPHPHDVATDASVTIHRCHTLSRQAEVLHDALLHAFHDLPGLQPHDVVIVSPCLEQLAPHLEAVFDREITGSDGRRVKLPLVVADRGLHEVGDAARLLIDVMRLVGSRCSIEEFRAVATHPLVRQNFGIDDDMIRGWDRLVARTKIHWGFDAAHRAREHFPAAATAPHTWRAGLERMLLGAVLPITGAPMPPPGVTIPLDDVPLGALPAIETLARIFEVVRDLDDACHGTPAARSTSDWCDALEDALVGLCGPEAADLADPLQALRRLRAGASATPVPFHDVRAVLEETLTSVVGRQPLRTGAITATSLVPLRDVPFRVVCVAGYDDRAVAAAESSGDDLVARQPLAGDGDPRVEARRALLDCVLAARDRVLITCTGMDIRNNKPLPLVTPLAELVDFAVRHGVRPAAGEHPSGIEIRHPRHAVGRRNFEPGAVQPGRTWSHDAAACRASQALGGEAPPRVTLVGDPPELPVVELSLLEDMVRDPLRLYLRKTLGIDLWRDEEEFPAATFPLALTSRESRELTEDLLRHRLADGDTDAWVQAVQAAGRIPFGRFGAEALREVRALVDGIVALAADPKKPVPLTGFTAKPVRVGLPGRLLSGTLTQYAAHPGRPDADVLVDIRVSRGERDAWGLPLHIAALRLLVAWAAGLTPDRAIVVARHKDWKAPTFDGPAAIARSVQLADALRGQAAAAERLARICDLLPRALAAPCGRFGGVVASVAEKLAAGDHAGARQKFANHVSHAHEGTAEEMVYGPAPRFDDIFGPDSPEVAFHTDFERLFTLSRTYVLS